jgi:hypothetical protein
MSAPSRTESIILTYLGVSLVALLYRVVVIPWDWGGLFLQFMAAFFAAMIIGNVNLPALHGFQLKVFYALFVIANVLSFVEVYFATQAIAPFIIVCLVLVGVWGRKKESKSKLLETLALALPLAGLMFYGLTYTIPVYRLRHLSSEQVREIRLSPGKEGETNIQLSSEAEITPFLLALSKTTPYAPKGEEVNAHRQVTILLNSGDKISFTMGKGTLANANTCHIKVGVTSYQNEPLCRLLESLAPR